MTDYSDKPSVLAAKSECRKRCRNAPLKVSELMKAYRLFDAGDRFREWLRQQGRLAALDEIYACEFESTCSRTALCESFRQAVQLGHANTIDPTGAYFSGYEIVATEYLQAFDKPAA